MFDTDDDAGFGRKALVGLRQALGLTTKELADAIGVPELQVVRDEKNEYRGLSVRRAQRLLAVLRQLEVQAADLEVERRELPRRSLVH